MDILNESKFQGRQVAYLHRASVAERWARKMLWFTVMLGLFAVWQNRELAPPVHDGMFVVADVSLDVLGGAHETRATLQSYLSGASTSGTQPEFNAITRWLLDNR